MTTISRIESAEAAPKSFGVLYWMIVSMVAFLLFGIQIAMGTQLEYAALVLSFTLLAAGTFRAAGGFKSFIGFITFFLAMQHIIFSQWVKVFFLQRPDVIMYVPVSTMTMYNVGMLGLLIGVYILKFLKIGSWGRILPTPDDPEKLLLIAVALVLLSVIRGYIVSRYGIVEQGGLYIGGFVGFWRNLQFVQFMSVAAATAYAIIKSDGKKCFNFLNLTALAVAFGVGIIYGVRNDIVFASLTFVTTCLAYGFRFGVRHYVFLGLLVFLFLRVISPYALYARSEGNVRVGSAEERVTSAISAIGEVILEPNRYRKVDESIETGALPQEKLMTKYYGINNNILERFAVVCWSSSVVYNTNLKGTTGDSRIVHGFQMILPRAIAPDKPAIGTANLLAQQGIGLVNSTDDFTQIVLGFMVDAYNSFGIYCTFLTSILVMIFIGCVMALTFGVDVRKNFLVCGVFWMFGESFSEGTIAQIIVTWTFETVPAVVIMLFLILTANAFTRRSRVATHVYEHDRGAVREIGA
ncbi:MAG: hypothetical protein KF812_04215 [Fimbriimonadaceae bacterium]|nr:hypothetical protein [Fimbriimonadaceae bacterium]